MEDPSASDELEKPWGTCLQPTWGDPLLGGNVGQL